MIHPRLPSKGKEPQQAGDAANRNLRSSAKAVQSPAPVFARGWPSGKQPCTRGTGRSSGHQGGHEPALCPCGNVGWWYPGLHQEGCGKQAEKGDPSFLPALVRPHEALCPVLASPVSETQSYWRQSTSSHQDWLGDWSTSHMRKGLDRRVYLAQKRETSK